MSLTELIEGYRSSVREFLEDRNAGALFVLAAPEAESVAAKAIASVEEEPTSDDLMLAHTGPFNDPLSYYRAAAATVLENFVEHREALKEELVHFVLPSGLDEENRESGISAEFLFADFAERCSRALFANVAKRLVFVLRAEETPDPAAFVTSTALLGSLVAPERTKFIVFASPACAPPEQAPPVQRLAVVEPERERALQRELLDFVGSPTRRVLVVRCSQLSSDRAIRELDALRRSHFRVALRPGPQAAMLEAAAHALAAQARERGLEPDAPDLTVTPVDRLAALSESIAAQLSAAHGACIVSFELQGFVREQLDLAREFVIALGVAACSPRVRYVLLDATEAGLFPRLAEAPRRVRQLKVGIAPDALESGFKARLELPELPLAERIQCLQGLAMIASTRREHETALSLHDQALGCAEQINQPATNCVVWLGIGHSLYRAGSFEAAEGAFSRSLTLALDASLTASIPEATLQLANALLCQNKFADAISCFDSAIAWYENLGVPLFALHAQTWLGETKRRAGDTRGAEQIWQAANQRYAGLGGDFRDVALEGRKQVLGRLVKLHQQTGNAAQVALRKDELRALGSAPILTEQP